MLIRVLGDRAELSNLQPTNAEQRAADGQALWSARGGSEASVAAESASTRPASAAASAEAGGGQPNSARWAAQPGHFVCLAFTHSLDREITFQSTSQHQHRMSQIHTSIVSVDT